MNKILEDQIVQSREEYQEIMKQRAEEILEILKKSNKSEKNEQQDEKTM